MDEEIFYNLGAAFIKHSGQSLRTGRRRFKAFFGCTPQVCAILWQHLQLSLERGYTKEHLLWGLFFLKCYNTEHVNRTFANCDEKTFRHRTWRVVGELARLNIVSLFY